MGAYAARGGFGHFLSTVRNFAVLMGHGGRRVSTRPSAHPPIRTPILTPISYISVGNKRCALSIGALSGHPLQNMHGTGARRGDTLDR